MQISKMETDATDFKRKIESLNLDVQKGNNIITSLKKDIEGLKKEIQERDDTIQDKVSLNFSKQDQNFLLYLLFKILIRKKEFTI